MTRLKPWLWISPAIAHKLSPSLIKSLGLLGGRPPEWNTFKWRGLHFPNRLGIAGGVDKDAVNTRDWWRLGAGFVEVGTITPHPQRGNTPPVLDRDVEHEALWNRMGFPSKGVAAVKKRLKKLPRPFAAPVFANIGKNATTSLDQAAQDYLYLLEQLRGLVDGFVVNISSPNTKGLRDLLKPERLTDFLAPVLAQKSAPILLKVSPDMEDEELDRVLTISHDLGIDGWILTNTSQGIRENLHFPKEGGVSGRPLGPRSKQLLQRSLELLGARRKDKLIVSVGGVMTAEDVTERLALGADLVQVYAALVFQGPFFLRKVAQCQQVPTKI